MLRVLERMAGARTGLAAKGSITKRLRANGAELFQGVTRVASTISEYWLKATERIMNDLKCTLHKN